nr:unnamed protein product [Fasciola hepatica]
MGHCTAVPSLMETISSAYPPSTYWDSYLEGKTLSRAEPPSRICRSSSGFRESKDWNARGLGAFGLPLIEVAAPSTDNLLESKDFDAERRCSNELQNTCGADVRLSNLVLHCLPDRRPSFIYRLETDDCYSVYSSRHTSITGDETLSDTQLKTLSQHTSQSASVPIPAATQGLGNSSVYEPSEKTINDLNANGYQLRHERRSLPDVVITSASMASTKPCILKKPSLQLDSETGRRPTLDVETTARLAEAESVGFDEAVGADATPMKTDYRSKSLGATQLSKQIHGSPQTRASTSNAAHHNDTSMNKNLKKNSLMRLSTLKRFQKHLRKLGSLKLNHTSEKVGSDGSEDDPTVSLRRSKESHLLEEEDDLSEPTSVGDRLGQLPPKSMSRSSRLAGYGAGEGIYKSINITDKLNSTHSSTTAAVPRPGGIRRGSLCIFSQVDEPIVTPFAQILASLRRVRANFILLTNVHSSKDSHFGTSHAPTGDERRLSRTLLVSEQLKSTAAETLEELEWCLERLENIQTHRSVSDMASSKFKKMLNKELSQFTDGGRNSKQISEYICSTFLDSKEVEGTSVTDGASDAAYPSSNEYVPSDSEDRQQSAGMSTTELETKTGPVVLSTPADLSVQGRARVSDIASHFMHSTDEDEVIKPYGVVSNYPKQLETILIQSLDIWGLDTFEMARLTPNPLTCVFYSIVQKRGLIKRFALSERVIIRYMNVVEDHYRAVTYHNRVHAADVVQSTHVLLNAPALSSVFTDLEVLAVLFACAVHDVDHPGLTNQYLINSNDHLAIMYNDASVLENHHLAVAFQLLNRSGCDMFENLAKKQRLSLRRMTIDMVLATDMSKHMSLLADLKTMVETKKVAGSGILTLDNYSDRMQILQNMIHCSDLSNPTKPLALYRQWTKRIMEELFRQGDREREKGMELSPMCDRNTASEEKTQVSFIDYIVHPLWETWSELVHPDAQKILETLEDNREWYLAQMVEESQEEPNKDG